MASQPSLWRHHDFLKLWTAHTLASLSSNVTTLALPLIAALTLHASPFEMGLLGTMATLPNLVVGLLAGTRADRTRRRPTLITAHLVRALLLISIPVAFGLGVMTIWHLYAVLFLFGVCTTFSEVAQVTYLPTLVGRGRLLAANSQLAASSSAMTAVGPGLAGVLIQLLTAPLAVLADAGTLLVSATLVTRIKTTEPRPKAARQKSIGRTIHEGLKPLYTHPLLRSVAGSSMIYLFFSSVMLAVYVLYATREVGLSPAALGVVYGVGGVGAVLGASVAVRATTRFGLGPTMIGANLVGGLFILLVPFADDVPPTAALSLLCVSQGVSQLMGAVFYVNQTSLLQQVAPEHLLGRMVASHRFLTMGVIPLGSLLGGVLGEVLGLRPTLGVGAVGMLLPTVWLWFSPLRTIRTRSQDNAPGEIV